MSLTHTIIGIVPSGLDPDLAILPGIVVAPRRCGVPALSVV